MVKQCGDYATLDYDVLNHGLGRSYLHLNQTTFNEQLKIGDQGVVAFHYVFSNFKETKQITQTHQWNNLSEKYKIKFQLDIGLIYGRDHFYYYVKQKKSRKSCAWIFFKNTI